MQRVAIVGVGGIGSHLVDHINALCAAGEFKNFEFTIFDDDVVEPKNLKYQKFQDKDMGAPKVEALYSTYLDIPRFIPENRRVQAKELTNYHMVVICVDSGEWRKSFFSQTKAPQQWIDLRSEGRSLAAYTSGKKNTAEYMNSTLESATKNNGSCQLAHEFDKGIIQAGNRVVAMIGVQYLLNYCHGETSPPEFIQRF